MESPVRIIENEKIHTFNEKVTKGLEQALNFMLGADATPIVQIGNFEPFLMPVETYLQVYKKQSVLIKIHSDQDYQGELYWFFEMKTATVLASLMRMVPGKTVEEKLAQGTFDATDQDSFGEVGNQLSGILDRAFRTLTRKNIHLRMDFKKVIYPSSAVSLEDFVNREEYVVLLAPINFTQHGKQKLTLLLPRSLYEVMLALEVSLTGITPKKILFYSWSETEAEQMQTALNSRHSKVIRVDHPEDVLNYVDESDVAAIGMNLKRPNFPLQHQDVILFKRLAMNKSFTRFPYFLTWDQATEAEVNEVKALGLAGTSVMPFATDFIPWAKGHSQPKG